MSGETEVHISGWTTDTLHSHLKDAIADLRLHMEAQLSLMRQMTTERHASEAVAVDKAFRAQETANAARYLAAEKAVEAALAAADKAVLVFKEDSRTRFESVNAFRAQLSDMIRTLMPRAEAEAVIARATESLNDIRTRAADWPTRTEMNAMGDRNAERIGEVASRLDKLEARGAQAKESKAGTYAFVGAAVAVLGILIVVMNQIT